MYHEQYHQVLNRVEQAKKRLRQVLFPQSKKLELRYARCTEHLCFTEKDRLSYQSIQEGEEWGRSGDLKWQSAWFCAHTDLGEGWEQHLQNLPGAELALQLSFNGEGLVYTAAGRVLQGISDGSVYHNSFQRSLVMRAEELVQGGKIEVWIEAAANSLFGLERPDDPRHGTTLLRKQLRTLEPQECLKSHHKNYYGEHIGRVLKARIVLFDSDLWRYLLELDAAGTLARQFVDEEKEPAKLPPRAKKLIFALDQSLACYRYRRENLAAAYTILHQALANGNAPSDLRTIAVGHAHIDTAWLWPVKETVRKCARTFQNQLRLMERYPDFVFGASQAQHYAFIKEHYPEIYAGIQERVAEGRWEIQGAMWVEADCNLPSGESLVRQVLHGKNFFRDEFGVDVQNLWLPDVFGYSANLPQILQRAGVPYFLTQKLSWSQYNDFPHHTFYWRGVDGSRVLTHFPPEATYNSTMTLGGVHGMGLRGAQNQFKEGHLPNEFMTLFGIGDGGGGCDEEMLERAQLLGTGVEGSPRVVLGRSDAFFQRLAESKNSEDLATWSGELYLELHRGTLTSQAKTKSGNRRLEQKLRFVEYIYSIGDGDYSNYPRESLEQVWKLLLLNQFHDIIPGSSIHEVYQHTEQEYAEGLAILARLEREWLEAQALAPEYLSVLNPYSLASQTVVELPAGWQGAALAPGHSGVTILACAAGRALLFLEPQAVAVLQDAPSLKGAAEPQLSCRQEGLSLENDVVRYEFSHCGQVVRAYDKKLCREIMCAGTFGNRLALYCDWPSNWDAWEVDLNYENEELEVLQAHRWQPLDHGSLRRGLYFEYSFGEASAMEQEITLEAGSKLLSFANRVDWQERHKMLRVSFQPEIFSHTASYDIQYAYLERPTHRNTSWDMAQFEVVGHRYADLSDYDYGLALLNDCKYGYKIRDNWMDLNLLRSPTLPDPDADNTAAKAKHNFRYAILPHQGCLQDAMTEIQSEAALFNHDIGCFPGRMLKPDLPLRLDSQNVTLEVLKKAEKGPERIVRLVERAGKHSKARLEFSGVLQECDLMEWQDIGKPLTAPDAALEFPPFAIRTFRLK